MNVKQKIVPPRIVVVDTGGRYCRLIASRVRELGVYAEIKSASTKADEFRDYQGIVVSGGPASVYASDRPQVDGSLFQLDLPILGICYGHQLMADDFGGKVVQSGRGEYGLAYLKVREKNSIFRRLRSTEPVWMSHRDEVCDLPPQFNVIGETSGCRVAAMAHATKPLYGLQFHPEVVDTKRGNRIFQNFVTNVC